MILNYISNSNRCRYLMLLVDLTIQSLITWNHRSILSHNIACIHQIMKMQCWTYDHLRWGAEKGYQQPETGLLAFKLGSYTKETGLSYVLLLDPAFTSTLPQPCISAIGLQRSLDKLAIYADYKCLIKTLEFSTIEKLLKTIFIGMENL